MKNKLFKDFFTAASVIASVIGITMSLFVFFYKTNPIEYKTFALGILGAAIGAFVSLFYAKVRTALNAPRVFIAYSAKDKETVNKIYKSIEHLPIKILLDQNELNVGDNISNKINELVTSSDYFVFVGSENSSKSTWAEKELSQAIKLNKKILPVVVDDTPLPPNISNLVYADLRKSPELGIEQLIKAIKNSRHNKKINRTENTSVQN